MNLVRAALLQPLGKNFRAIGPHCCWLLDRQTRPSGFACQRVSCFSAPLAELISMIPRLSEHRRMHLEAWDSHTHGTTLLSRSEKRSCRSALCFDDVIRVVAEGLAGFETRELSHHAITFHDKCVTIGITHDPLTTKDVHGLCRAIVNGDMIHEWMWPVRWCRARWIIRHVINECA